MSENNAHLSESSKKRTHYWRLATLGLREQLEIESSERWLDVKFEDRGLYIAVHLIAFDNNLYGHEIFYVQIEED